VHLLRELKTVDTYDRPGPNWPTFAKKLRRLVGDAIRLKKREDVPVEEYASRRACLTVRRDELIAIEWEDKDAKRLIKRLRRHRDELLTFLDEADVPFDNNHAERAIRPAVMIRKNSFGNRSDRGADTQAVLMSLYRTLQQRGHAPAQDGRRCAHDLPQDWQATSATGKSCCKRLKSYLISSFEDMPRTNLETKLR
jgi:transposase